MTLLLTVSMIMSTFYSRIRAMKSSAGRRNAEDYVRELQRAGYATDPDYAAKISRIARQIQQQQPVLMAQGPALPNVPEVNHG